VQLGVVDHDMTTNSNSFNGNGQDDTGQHIPKFTLNSDEFSDFWKFLLLRAQIGKSEHFTYFHVL
jgi:hypothetical protein